MATKTVSASYAFRQVASGETIDNSRPVAVPPLAPGDNTVQGDVYLTRLDREIPGGVPAPSRQLAPGTSQGSRHVAVGDCDVLTVPEAEAVRAINRLVPATKGQRLFIGPMIRARGELTVEHPEHAHQTLEGGACYLVTYQRAFADTIRRTLD